VFIPEQSAHNTTTTTTTATHLGIMPSSQPAAGELEFKPEYVSDSKITNGMASKSEPNRNPKYDPKKPHITDLPITSQNWYKHVNWLNVILIGGVPLAGLVASAWTPLRLSTAVWSVLYYFATGLGITAGYHRLWAHKSYSATRPLEIFLALVGAGAVEGSIRWWSRDHRAHHRYTDTDKDPYSVRKGLLYSHLGWMIMKQNPKRIGRTDISDLNENAIVVAQHKHYLKAVIFMGLVFPTLVAGLGWNDWLGGFIYAGILRIFFVQQATFCVNSLAHWLGDQPFDDRNSPRDHLVTALVTLGEGYHNFHHEFPSDYRNAIEWYQYDPTKWFIWTMKKLGLAYDLKQFRANEIEKGRVQQTQKKLDQARAKLDWGVPLETLPVMEWDDYVEQAKNGRGLIAVAGVVHDVSDFIKDHPGGKAMIMSGVGKDATSMFNGGVYNHSNAAHNLLSTMRVGVIRGGMEVEIWKRAQRENKDVQYVKDDAGNRIIRAGNQVTKIQEPVATAGAA
jgi:stearoyl-CoA desaturase (delta-9 desaturase)